MEDALVPKYVTPLLLVTRVSLNPCCNGRCTRTGTFVVESDVKGQVLILVVMEDALVLVEQITATTANEGLNPCCNGRCTRTAKLGLCFV